MKALISSIEPRETGFRVAQVEPDHKTFPVADGLFWVTCASDVIADQFWYDPNDQEIKPIPPEVIPENQQPISEGTQEI